MRKIFILIPIFLLLSGCLMRTSELDLSQENVAGKSDDLDIHGPTVTQEIQEATNQQIFTEEKEVKLPSTFDLEVSFASQAPTGDWQLPYQEACEEASLITVAKYFKQETLDNDIMDAEIKKLVDWEITKMGLYTDTSAEEVVMIARDYFGLKAEINEDVSIEKIKQELVAGNLIIAPFSGRDLGNEYFTEPGPIYHMLVIRGYDRNEFITNDVGTRHGESYKYEYNVLIDAIHDLPLKADGTPYRFYDDKEMTDEAKVDLMRQGQKVIIVISGIEK